MGNQEISFILVWSTICVADSPLTVKYLKFMDSARHANDYSKPTHGTTHAMVDVPTKVQFQGRSHQFNNFSVPVSSQEGVMLRKIV